MAGETSYPGAIDSLPITKTNATVAKNDHPDNHNNTNAAVNAIEGELGVNPSGEAATVAAAVAAKAAGFTPTGVKTAEYSAVASDYVPVNISGGSVTIKLPSAPADKTRIGVKIVKISGTPGSTTVKVKRGGTDVFNIAGGSTELTLEGLFQGIILQYQSSTGIWYVQSTDTSLTAVVKAAPAGGVASWESGKAYILNSLVIFNEQLYLCKSEHTSSAGFDRTKWQPINPVYAENTPEYWGAKRDGVTNDTEAFEACEEAVGSNGGTIYLSIGTYILDGLQWSKGIRYEGVSQSINGTVIKAKKNSTKLGVIELDSGVSGHFFGAWKKIWFSPDTSNETREGLPPQDCFYLAVTGEGIPGLNNAIFEDINIGTTGGIQSWAGNCMWFRGGPINSAEPHQYITFRNVKMAHKTSGPFAKSSRSLKCTGQNNKFEFDGASYPASGSEVGKHIGTNIELNCEYITSTTLKAEAAAGATTIEVNSTAGLTEANKKFELGEGAEGEVLVAASVAGNIVTLKAGTSLARTHVVGENVKPNSGTVAAPAAKASAHFYFNGGTYQNADLHCLCGEGSLNIEFRNSDFEEQSRVMLVREGSYQCNLHNVKPNGATEGEVLSTGTLTVGSKIITSASTSWVNGDIIVGRGIPLGTTVVSGGGTSTIELSAAVTSGLGGGTLAVTGVPLSRGGEGGGYIAKFDKNTQGTVSYHSTGIVDNAIINHKEGGGRHWNVSRGTPLLVPTTTGVTLALGTAEKLAVQNARDIVLTNATNTIKYFNSIHATGETLTITATVAGTKFESTGNIYLGGATKIELQVGGVAIFQRTDSGQTWKLITYTQPTLEPQTFTENGTYNIPLTAKFLRITAVGGGGGGGGAGSAAAAQLQAGGGGGAAGTASVRILEVGAAATAAVTVGAGGAGGSSGAAGGNAGGEGESGKESKVEVGANKVIALGGMKGGNSTASSTTRGTGGVYGAPINSATLHGAGCGGNNALGQGGYPSGGAAGGGGAGGAATATNGGSAGTAGTTTAQGAVGSSGGSGTSEGGEGAAAAANSGAGGPGGGGGAAGTGKGGKGGAGGSGVIVIEPIV